MTRSAVRIVAVSMLLAGLHLLAPTTTFGQGSIDIDTKDLFFENFHYSSQADLFDEHDWETGESNSITDVGWRRFNWNDNPFGEGNISFSNGWMVMSVPESTPLPANPGNPHLPSVLLNTVLGKGTYAARVKFHRLDDDNFLIAAFWSGSANRFIANDANETALADELDIELNSCFFRSGDSDACDTQDDAQMNVSNWQDDDPTLNQMQCFGSDGESRILDDEGDCEYNDENLWEADRDWYLMYTWDDSEVRYYLYSSGTGLPISWTASDADWLQPTVITENLPHDDALIPQFLLRYVDKGSSVQDYVLDYELRMDVEWFYYNQSTAMSLSDVLQDVSNLKSDGHKRVNTTGTSFLNVETDQTPAAGDLSISGPTSITAKSSHEWKIELPPSGGKYDLEFEYRFQSEGGVAGKVTTTASSTSSSVVALTRCRSRLLCKTNLRQRTRIRKRSRST